MSLNFGQHNRFQKCVSELRFYRLKCFALDENVSNGVNDWILSPIELAKNIENDAYKLPNNYFWSTIDPENRAELTELELFLGKHYVEEKTNAKRLQYSADFLKWSAP